jgi:hypothetical protein
VSLVVEVEAKHNREWAVAIVVATKRKNSAAGLSVWLLPRL